MNISKIKQLEEYQVGRGFLYENIILHKTFNISKNGDSVISENINIPRRSMTGILCLVNPSITYINIV